MPVRLEPLSFDAKRTDKGRPQTSRGHERRDVTRTLSAAGNPARQFGGRDFSKPLAAAGTTNGASVTPTMIGTDQIQFFDYNLQATKKSVSSALLDVALLMANASQLKTVYTLGHRHPFYSPMLALLSCSIILQILIGIIIIWLSRININEPDEKKHKMASALNTTVVISVFVLTVVNVFISTIGISANQEEALLSSNTSRLGSAG